MSDYTVHARMYNYTRKGKDFTYGVWSFHNLGEAQQFGRWYVSNFNVVFPFEKLREVWIESWDWDDMKYKQFGLYS